MRKNPIDPSSRYFRGQVDRGEALNVSGETRAFNAIYLTKPAQGRADVELVLLENAPELVIPEKSQLDHLIYNALLVGSFVERVLDRYKSTKGPGGKKIKPSDSIEGFVFIFDTRSPYPPYTASLSETTIAVQTSLTNALSTDALCRVTATEALKSLDSGIDIDRAFNEVVWSKNAAKDVGDVRVLGDSEPDAQARAQGDAREVESLDPANTDYQEAAADLESLGEGCAEGLYIFDIQVGVGSRRAPTTGYFCVNDLSQSLADSVKRTINPITFTLQEAKRFEQDTLPGIAARVLTRVRRYTNRETYVYVVPTQKYTHVATASSALNNKLYKSIIDARERGLPDIENVVVICAPLSKLEDPKLSAQVYQLLEAALRNEDDEGSEAEPMYSTAMSPDLSYLEAEPTREAPSVRGPVGCEEGFYVFGMLRDGSAEDIWHGCLPRRTAEEIGVTDITIDGVEQVEYDVLPKLLTGVNRRLRVENLEILIVLTHDGIPTRCELALTSGSRYSKGTFEFGGLLDDVYGSSITANVLIIQAPLTSLIDPRDRGGRDLIYTELDELSAALIGDFSTSPDTPRTERSRDSEFNMLFVDLGDSDGPDKLIAWRAGQTYDRFSDILVPIPEGIKNAIQPTTDDEVAALYSGLGKTLYERISSALERDAYSLGNTRLAILPLKPSYESQIIDTQVFGTKAPLIDYVGTEANLTPGEDHIIVVGIPVGGSTDSSLSDSFYEELSDVLSQILDETDPDFDSDKDDIYI